MKPVLKTAFASIALLCLTLTPALWADEIVSLKPPKNAIVLFDGKDVSKFEIDGKGTPIKWKVEGGVLECVPKSGSIVTKREFQDFQLHLEFATPNMPDASGQGRGNSGVYIQRRYEVQILDTYGLPLEFNHCAALYRTKAPDIDVCKKAGEWQSYDIVFRAPRWEGDKKIQNARITVVHNGVVVHNNVDLPNKTGAGKPEGPEPGPIKLQDHGNKVQFRNIWIIPLEAQGKTAPPKDEKKKKK